MNETIACAGGSYHGVGIFSFSFVNSGRRRLKDDCRENVLRLDFLIVSQVMRGNCQNRLTYFMKEKFYFCIY